MKDSLLKYVAFPLVLTALAFAKPAMISVAVWAIWSVLVWGGFIVAAPTLKGVVCIGIAGWLALAVLRLNK